MDFVVDDVIEQLKQAFDGDVESCGDTDLSYLMHLMIERGRIIISMVAYLEGELKEYEVHGTVTTPATSSLFETSGANTSLSQPESKRFHTLVAKLLYHSKRARMDILFPIAFLTTRVKAPTTHDLAKLQRVMKYLNGTSQQSTSCRSMS